MGNTNTNFSNVYAPSWVFVDHVWATVFPIWETCIATSGNMDTTPDNSAKFVSKFWESSVKLFPVI